jgi:hypothetical protein
MADSLILELLRAADPARDIASDEQAAEMLLARLLASPSGGHVQERFIHEHRRTRRPRIVFAFVLIGGFALATAAALAAAGVIRFGAPAKLEQSLNAPHVGLGAPSPGAARVLSLRVADPAGGPPWGLRVVTTTRGVGCVEAGRVLNGQLGVLGQDGAFSDDGRFHPLPSKGLQNAACASLDANGRLFETSDIDEIPASGWSARGSCLLPHTHRLRIKGVPPQTSCPHADIRSLDYGLLGPQAKSITYTLNGRTRTIKPTGEDGAYLIVGLPRHPPTLGADVSGMLPLPASSLIKTIAYRDGTVCDIAATHPRRTPSPACRPPGYQPVTAPRVTHAQVATPITTQIITTPSSSRPILGSHREIRISFLARVAVSQATSSYELIEDPSSPFAVFDETQRDIAAGETVTWTIPAPRPGTYSGKITLGLGGVPPYPTYSWAPGPAVGRFKVTVR